jgi:hypothetical protein
LCCKKYWIKELKNKKKEYFLDNSKYIFDYFENKKNISNINSNYSENNKTNILNNFFKINIDKNPSNTSQNTDNNIVQKYLSNIDDSYFDKSDISYFINCLFTDSFIYPNK